MFQMDALKAEYTAGFFQFHVPNQGHLPVLSYILRTLWLASTLQTLLENPLRIRWNKQQYNSSLATHQATWCRRCFCL